ncbi:coiled-coil domain-containing protein 152 isoform X2 [Sceloporus undulatus]|uniref:coiled-coil domain-containing protein 152 isoform X2 n=1 Tax=Sceloporus undulatus TaxID=8520 RepID=UPI001C4CBC1F|nr:coiled-coil domain-containing protein 152 isoform X2 [Sceloporus undulatus]
MKKNSLVNLDKLLEDFSHIEMKISELHGKNNLLTLQLDKTHKLLTMSQSKEESAKEDENERIKSTAHILEEKLKAQEQEHKNMVERLLRDTESKTEAYKLEQRKLHCDMNKKFEAMEEEHKQLIQKKDLEILELNTQLRAQEKEKQNEIIKLQIEFNAKLAKLQIPKPYPNPTGFPQTIYRRVRFPLFQCYV